MARPGWSASGWSSTRRASSAWTRSDRPVPSPSLRAPAPPTRSGAGNHGSVQPPGVLVQRVGDRHALVRLELLAHLLLPRGREGRHHLVDPGAVDELLAG